MSDNPNPIGRPSKYKEEYCKMIIDHMAQGRSIASFASSIDVNKDTIYEWKKHHEKFSDAIKVGWAKSEAWWEEQGRMGLWNKDLNASIYIFTMKTRFSHREENNVNIHIDTPETCYNTDLMSPEEYREFYAGLISKDE